MGSDRGSEDPARYQPDYQPPPAYPTEQEQAPWPPPSTGQVPSPYGSLPRYHGAGETGAGGTESIAPPERESLIRRSWGWLMVTVMLFPIAALWAGPRVGLVHDRISRGDLAGAQAAAKTVRIIGIVVLVLGALVLIWAISAVAAESEPPARGTRL